MKLPRLLLPVVFSLALCASSASAAWMDNLQASGNGNGMAVVVGGGSGYHEVMATPAVPTASYAPQFQIQGLEMASISNGIGTNYQARCRIFIGNDEMAVVNYHVTSWSNAIATIQVGNACYASGNTSGSCSIGSGDYDVVVSTSSSDTSGHAELGLYINVINTRNMTEEELQQIRDRDNVWVNP